MAKKEYNVAERFQEVARRARETGPIINTAPKKKPKTQSEIDAEIREGANTYATRPGASMKTINAKRNHGDVNLPIETASEEVKKRLRK